MCQEAGQIFVSAALSPASVFAGCGKAEAGGDGHCLGEGAKWGIEWGLKIEGLAEISQPPDFLVAYDLMNARREAVIVSPFITRRRALQMLPYLAAALAKRVAVVVVTRPTNAYKDKDKPALEETLASLQDAGVRLLFKANIHQKFAVIDQKIVWYGSINLLSYGSAQESLMRLDSPNIAQVLMKGLGK